MIIMLSLIILIIVMGVVITYKLIDNNVRNRLEFEYTVENINSTPVNTVSK